MLASIDVPISCTVQLTGVHEFRKNQINYKHVHKYIHIRMIIIFMFSHYNKKQCDELYVNCLVYGTKW